MSRLPPPFAIRLVLWIWNGLHGLADKFLPPEIRVVQLVSNLWKSIAIHTAAELQIAEHLTRGSKSVDELAKATSTHADSLYRLMRALASEGIFREVEGRRFETTPMGRALEANSATSIRPVAMLIGHETWRDAWHALPHSIQTGETAFEHVFGHAYFDYPVSHPEARKLFDSWMTRVAEMNRSVIRAIFGREQPGKVIDIGGGQGALINTALESNPRLTGLLFDLPEVVADATLNEEIGRRCEIVGGSFFETLPEGGDIYVLQQIIHDWGDEECLEILRRCHDAMNQGGRVFILDAILEERNEPDFNKFMDLQMLVLTRGGRERTEADFRDLLSRAGFAITRIVPTPSQLSLIEASKRKD